SPTEWRLNFDLQPYRTENAAHRRRCAADRSILAGHTLLGLRPLALRLVYGVQRPGNPHGTLRFVPDLLVSEVTENACDQQENGDRKACCVSVLQIWLRRPHQEGRDVSGHLVDGRLGAVFIADLTVR